jgi:predicted CxxxxCH...CXXCH cytochrome family protein
MSPRLALASTLAATAALALTACSDIRGVTSQPGPVVGCALCHGTAGRAGNLPGTDPLLEASPPTPPSGAPSYAVGAHQAHLNPTASAALAAPIACNECHLVPPNASHATNPPATRVVFGTRATTQGRTPVWNATTTGCSATYCHGSFTFNGVTGDAATPLWTDTGIGCTSCHGMPPTGHPSLTGTVTAVTCASCHPDTVQRDGTINVASGAHINGQADVSLDCTSCHGTKGRTGFQPGTDGLLEASPPVAPVGAPSYAVGAHQAHLNPPSNGSFRAPLPCNECHVVPADSAHAVNPPPSKVAFGTLARTQGASPSWNASVQGCSATYCHGSFDLNGVRGAAGAPTWTATTITCLDCHGLPPQGHPTLAPPVTAVTCAGCHPSTVRPDGTINVSSGAHVNGQADVAAGCTACHGTPGRPVTATNPLLDAAPPVGAPGTSARTVGAHLLHLTDGTIRQGVACGNCHVVPADPDHSITKPTVIVWSPGTLATNQSARPSYDATALTCSATYCHGGFAFGSVTGNPGPSPAWDATPTGSCTVCHGMPPTNHQPLSGSVTAASCNPCHPDTVNASGTINVAGGRHMNGLADFTGGHPAGWEAANVHGSGPAGANKQGLPACTSCHVNFGPANGSVLSSCDACHTAAGHAGWKTECTFCHGDATRTSAQTGPFQHPAPTLALLQASPPVGPLGETGTSGPVGAHQRHVNPPSTGARSTPFECGNCHGSSLPTDVTHVNGLLPTVPFGLIAITGGAAPSFNFGNLSCSATYCHGNFTGGVGAGNSVSWGASGLACNACHGIAPSTGEHQRSPHVSAGCGACHSGYTSSAVNLGLHVNGTKDVGGTGTRITSWNSGTQNCTPTCHGQQRW